MSAILKRGDRRPDGFRFFGYEKRDGKFREKWSSPASWARLESHKLRARLGSPPRPQRSGDTPQARPEYVESIQGKVIRLLEKKVHVREICKRLGHSSATVCLISRPWRERQLRNQTVRKVS